MISNSKMSNKVRTILVAVFICLNCFQAKSQLSFQIDSLYCFCFGDFGYDMSWDNSVLFHLGPDILIYGRVINNQESPIIIELTESQDSTLSFFKELRLYVSYHNKTQDFLFAQNPRVVTDIMSYPYWEGMGLPSDRYCIEGKVYSYSVIKPGESIPLAFETLSKSTNICNVPLMSSINPQKYKRVIRAQKREIKYIESSIKIIPTIVSHIDSADLDNLLLDYVTKKDAVIMPYNYEASIPQRFLDKKPSFINGGIDGFYRWFNERIGEDQSLFLGRERQLLCMFVVGSDGNVVYSKVSSSLPKNELETMESLFNSIILRSPKWSAGELNGHKVDSRITLLLSIDVNGAVKVKLY